MKTEDQKVWDVFTQTGKILMKEDDSIHPPEVLSETMNSILDFHHLTLQEAHQQFQKHIEDAVRLGYKNLTHITGKSGQICKEYPTWVQLNSNIRKFELQKNGGSWKLWIKKQ